MRLNHLIPALVLSGVSVPARASVELNAGNTAWLLVATALVLFMTLPGLALFYGGLVRSKNALSIMMQCFAITCVVTLVWFGFGYGLAFGDGGAWNALIGSGRMALAGLERASLVGDTPESVYLMFQMTFAIITPALIIGAFAERMRFSAALLFSLAWFLLAYIPVCHWVWGKGWLAGLGVLDYAGGIVVHVNAGAAALVAALMVGRRHGFPEHAMPPHNMTLVVTGAGMLWVGWFGFNAGSALAANGDAGMTMLVTHLSAAAGALAWSALEWKIYGKPSALGLVTGMVAGLGTITPASGFVGPAAAVIIGFSAGALCYAATHRFKRIWKIDDSLDVSPVHGVGGALGSVLTGVFVAAPLGGTGLAEGVTMGHQVMVQLLAVVVTALWSAGVTWLVLKVLDRLVGLRVTLDEEREGLDLAAHGESAYIL